MFATVLRYLPRRYMRTKNHGDRLRSPFLIISVGVLLLQGCKDDEEILPHNSRPPIFTASFSSINIEDSEILRLTYSSFKIPNGFYQEDLQGGSLYYESTLSIMPLNLRRPPFFELSTNSQQQALAWSESSSVNSAYYRTLVRESETDRYFEFRRVYQKNQQDIILSRVQKLSYLDRSMYDFSHPASQIGQLNTRPIKESTIDSLAEYFWFIENYAIAGTKALAAVPDSSSDTVYCALYDLKLTPGDFGVHDIISLHRTVYAVSKLTGNIIRHSYTLRQVQAKMN